MTLTPAVAAYFVSLLLLLLPSVAPADSLRAATVGHGNAASRARISVEIPSTVASGMVLRVGVRVRTGATSVKLQRRVGRNWRTIASARTRPRGRTRTASLRWRPSRAGAVTLRVVALVGRRLVARSARKQVTVTNGLPPAPGNPGTAVAPKPGTFLEYFRGDGRVNAIPGGGYGFAVVQSLVNLSGGSNRSTVVSYDAEGYPLNRLPAGSFEGECGAADIMTPSGRRLVITAVETNDPARGIEPATYSLALRANDVVDNGREVWRTVVIPRTEGSGYSCEAYDGLLQHFSATRDGHWGVWYANRDFPGHFVIDLETGAARADDEAKGTIGNYIARWGISEDDPLQLTDPGTGTAVGSYRRGGATGAIPFYYGVDTAPTGVFETDSAGQSAPAGTSSDATILFGWPNEETFAVYELPSNTPLWRVPHAVGHNDYMWGAGGGVLLALQDCPDDKSKHCLTGFGDRSGQALWNVPSGEVCAVTDSQLMLLINSQFATIDLHSGEQVAYVTADRDTCPQMLPRGIRVRREPDGLSMTQELTP